MKQNQAHTGANRRFCDSGAAGCKRVSGVLKITLVKPNPGKNALSQSIQLVIT
jgi:hypothetical protein